MNKNRLFEHITRNVLRRLTLNEADDRADRVKAVIDATFKDLLKLDTVVPSSEYYVGNNEETTWRSYLYFNLRRSFGLMKNKDLSILDFIAPIAYSNDVKFDIDNSKVAEQNKLKEIVLILKDKTNGVFEKNLKGKKMTFGELCDIAEPYVQKKKQQEEYELENGDFSGGGNYEILEDVDFETAKRYGKMSCSQGKICYTQGENTWNSYKRKGRNKCYLLLRDGWENVEEKHTEPMYDFLPYDAYDEYGLSMIFVFVDTDNDIATSNTRWNHHADYGSRGCDKALNKVDISKLIGKKFSDVFKGYTEEEGVLKVTFDNAQELLNNGHKPEDVFDKIGNFKEGFARVVLNNNWNYIDSEYQIISDQWFNYVYLFHNGFSVVELNNVYNYINTKGELISDQWFDYSTDFMDGVAMVKKNNKWNFINENGNILSKQWFDYIDNFTEGFAPVKLNGKGWNYINIEVKILSKQWFDEVGDFKNGFAIVASNGKQKHINAEGKLIGDQWVEQAYDFKEGFGLVRIERGNWNFVNPNGEYLSEEGFDNANWFKNGLGDVQINGKWYKIDKNGNIIE